VTGAAAGIGRALALQLADAGCRVAVSDKDEEALAETARLVAARGAQVDSTRVDVTDRDAVQRWADRLADDFAGVRLVFNNAGVSLSATAETMSYEDLERLFAVNFWGVVHGTKAFLPHLRKAGDGCIVNMSSVFGLFAIPRQAAYCASKFAVRGFTEALQQELAVERCGVKAISVHPAGVRTDIIRSAPMVGSRVLGYDREQICDGFDRLARISADRAARKILRGVRRGRSRILVGFDAYKADWMQRLLPSLYQRLVVRRARPRLRSD
jgi:NAD(P)-dependent dehydrogenase (short-subunit alcohol dehydrogenase family)